MPAARRVVFISLAWTATISLLHVWLNSNALDNPPGGRGHAAKVFRVGFIPVT